MEKVERDKEQIKVVADEAAGSRKANEDRLSHPIISTMEPLTHEAYGGGMYGKDDDKPPPKNPRQPPASETQSADGPSDTTPVVLKHKPPPSSGDRDIDITGQSYIQ
ncbi:uncharacterized protein LOC111921224 [Lactuca sativa]|uniref:uncharacterized protein LOC111921224 n=1 Tax=Lactuca sativa TaxID=4236 RepID=UPI000CC78E35|nr:uncharacterized protein LOC111921224 [Lactuca sativa]